MIRIQILLFLLFFTFGNLKAQQTKIENSNREYYLKDSLLWDSYEKKMDLIFKTVSDKTIRNKLRDSLTNSVNLGNRMLAAEYKNSVGGIKRIFMTRNDFEKTELNKLLIGLSPTITQTEDYKALLKHVSTNQIKTGDLIPNIQFKDSENKTVKFENGYNNIIIYAAFATTDCMGSKNRSLLNKLISEVTFSKDNRIFLFYNTSDINELQSIRSKYKDKITYISDFTGPFSDFRIKTGSQASPTIYVFDKTGKLKTIELGVEYILENSERL